MFKQASIEVRDLSLGRVLLKLNDMFPSVPVEGRRMDITTIVEGARFLCSLVVNTTCFWYSHHHQI